MENRIEQLGRIIRDEFDKLTKDKPLHELLSNRLNVEMLIETSAKNGLYDLAHEMTEDFDFELTKI